MTQEGQENLKQRREAAGVSQRRLARRLGRTRAWVQRIEEAPIQTVWLASASMYLQGLKAEAFQPKPKLGRPKKGEVEP